MDAALVYLLASLTGNNAPPVVATDPSLYSVTNPVTATAISKAWPMVSATPAAGTVYTTELEFTGTWEGNAFGFAVRIGTTGSWTQFFPSVGAGDWGAGTVISGWVKLTVRVLTASTARFAFSGAIGEASSSYLTTSTVALAQLSQTLAVAAGDTITLGALFGASTSGQGITTYGSTFTTISS